MPEYLGDEQGNNHRQPGPERGVLKHPGAGQVKVVVQVTEEVIKHLGGILERHAERSRSIVRSDQ